MVKRCYIQNYPENFRGNTGTRTIASDFISPSIEAREKGGENAQIRHLDMAGGCKHVVRAGAFSQVVNLNRVRK